MQPWIHKYEYHWVSKAVRSPSVSYCQKSTRQDMLGSLNSMCHAALGNSVHSNKPWTSRLQCRISGWFMLTFRYTTWSRPLCNLMASLYCVTSEIILSLVVQEELCEHSAHCWISWWFWVILAKSAFLLYLVHFAACLNFQEGLVLKVPPVIPLGWFYSRWSTRPSSRASHKRSRRRSVSAPSRRWKPRVPWFGCRRVGGCP